MTPSARTAEPLRATRNQNLPWWRGGNPPLASITALAYRMNYAEVHKSKVPVHIAYCTWEKFELLAEILYCPSGTAGHGAFAVLLAVYPIMLISSVTAYLTYLMAGRIERRNQGKIPLFLQHCERIWSHLWNKSRKWSQLRSWCFKGALWGLWPQQYEFSIHGINGEILNWIGN